MEGGEFPGPIDNEDIIENEEFTVICDPENQHLNINLKDNLKEEENYIILNDKIWNYLSKLYGGWTIEWYGVENENGEPMIEVFLAKIYTYFFPMSSEN